MKKWFLILLLLVVVGVAMATSRRSFVQPVVGTSATPTWNPTNNTDGSVLLSWYVAEDYYTNGAVATLPDRWTNSFHLTNQVAASEFPTENETGLNSLPTIAFDGGDYLTCSRYTSAQPHEIWLVMKHTTPGGLQVFYSGNYNSGNFQTSYQNAETSYYHESGSPPLIRLGKPLGTNIWFVITDHWNLSSSDMRTNNVSVIGGTVGANSMHGFRLAVWNDAPYSYKAKIDVAEMITYGGVGSNNVPSFDATWRNNVWHYLTNKYALP